MASQTLDSTSDHEARVRQAEFNARSVDYTEGRLYYLTLSTHIGEGLSRFVEHTEPRSEYYVVISCSVCEAKDAMRGDCKSS